MMDAAEIARLRETAQKATPGDWRGGMTGTVEANFDGMEIARCMVKGRFGFPVGQAQANCAHIAAFDPATVLSLLDELEQARKERDEVVIERDEVRTDSHDRLAEVIAERDDFEIKRIIADKERDSARADRDKYEQIALDKQARYDSARAEEREACAKVADELLVEQRCDDDECFDESAGTHGRRIAAAIRARSS